MKKENGSDDTHRPLSIIFDSLNSLDLVEKLPKVSSLSFFAIEQNINLTFIWKFDLEEKLSNEVVNVR